MGCPASGIVSTTASVRNLVQASSKLKDVVLTSDGKTSFLVRRKGKQVARQCPLLGYEVRRIESGKQTDRKPEGHSETREACRELLTLVQAGWI